MSYVNLSNARNFVEACQEFKGNNVYAVWRDNLYIVYSYGLHFPMYVWDSKAGVWLANEDKYSVSTSKHQSKCRPSGDLIEFSTSALKGVIMMGGYMDYKPNLAGV